MDNFVEDEEMLDFADEEKKTVKAAKTMKPLRTYETRIWINCPVRGKVLEPVVINVYAENREKDKVVEGA